MVLYYFSRFIEVMTSLLPYIVAAVFCFMVAIFGIEVFAKRKILDKPGPDVPSRP